MSRQDDPNEVPLSEIMDTGNVVPLTRKQKRAAKQGMPVMASRTIAQWWGDFLHLLTGKREITRTVEMKAKHIRAGDLIPEFGGDRVADVEVRGGTTTLRMTGIDHDLIWLADVESDRLMEVRPVQRGYDA